MISIRGRGGLRGAPLDLDKAPVTDFPGKSSPNPTRNIRIRKYLRREIEPGDRARPVSKPAAARPDLARRPSNGPGPGPCKTKPTTARPSAGKTKPTTGANREIQTQPRPGQTNPTSAAPVRQDEPNRGATPEPRRRTQRPRGFREKTNPNLGHPRSFLRSAIWRVRSGCPNSNPTHELAPEHPFRSRTSSLRRYYLDFGGRISRVFRPGPPKFAPSRTLAIPVIPESPRSSRQDRRESRRSAVTCTLPEPDSRSLVGCVESSKTHQRCRFRDGASSRTRRALRDFEDSTHPTRLTAVSSS